MYILCVLFATRSRAPSHLQLCRADLRNLDAGRAQMGPSAEAIKSYKSMGCGKAVFPRKSAELVYNAGHAGAAGHGLRAALTSAA